VSEISAHIKSADKILAELDDPAVTNPLVGLLHVLLALAKIERARLRLERPAPLPGTPKA
jgi:hypothetical protein